jgi:aryl sulfotransferase
MPLHERAERAICLVRDPIDVMMSIWDFMHLMGHKSLLDGAEAEKEAIFRNFVGRWVTTGGDQIGGAGTWVTNVMSWLDQRALPVLLVRYESLKADPVAQLARVCTFLGAAVPPERIAQAAHRSDAGEMRKQEQREIDTKQAGAFYRPELETGYSRGFRFVGRLNQNSYDTMLTDAERRAADRVFGPVLARVAMLAR